MPPRGPQYTQNVKEQFPNVRLGVGWPKQFFTFSLLIFILVFLTYIGLAFGYKLFLNNSIEEMEAQLDQLSSQISEEQRENLAVLYSQVTNMRRLLNDHVLTSQVLEIIEPATSQEVAYLTFGLSVPDRELTLEGVAASYDVLVEQMMLYDEAPGIESIRLESSSFEDGVIMFKVDLILEESVLRAI